jgi:hypothetical protein
VEGASTLAEAISALLSDPVEGALDETLARSILGTCDPGAIASRVEGYVRESFRCGICSCLFFTQSVGAVWGLKLEDGARVALKAHALARGPELRAFRTLDELGAVYGAQARFAELGFPCAKVLRAPRPWSGGAVAAMELLSAPRGEDPHDASVRSAMAEILARSVELGRTLPESLVAQLPRADLPEGSILPAPHNALFRFDAPGGEWIDVRARDARSVLGSLPERCAVVHTDVSGANVRVVDGDVVAVFDMDSVARTDEMRALAGAAVHFTYRGAPPWTWPTREESIAFVEDYLRARGRGLDRDEKRRLDSAAIYALAYSARCEHGLETDPDAPPDTRMRRALREAPDRYFG